MSIGESESCGGSGALVQFCREGGVLSSRRLGGEWNPRSVVASMFTQSRDYEGSRALRRCRPVADIIERQVPIWTTRPTAFPLSQAFYTNHCRIAKAEL